MLALSLKRQKAAIFTDLKVEYHAYENPLKNSEKIEYVGQMLMFPIIKKNNTLPH